MTDEKSKLFDAVYKSSGMDYLNRQKIHHFSYNIFIGNYEELKKVIKIIENPNLLNEMMCDKNRKEMGDPLHMDLNRHFHNYLAAAKSLIDHTRVFMKSYYMDTPFKSEFDKKIKNEFADNPLSRFIQDLRNYMLHRGLNSSVSMSVTKIDGTNNFHAESTANLKKSELLEWDRWSKQGKLYLTKCEDKITISTFCIRYGERVKNLYSWFEKELYDHHSEDYLELVKAQRELNKHRSL